MKMILAFLLLAVAARASQISPAPFAGGAVSNHTSFGAGAAITAASGQALGVTQDSATGYSNWSDQNGEIFRVNGNFFNDDSDAPGVNITNYGLTNWAENYSWIARPSNDSWTISNNQDGSQPGIPGDGSHIVWYLSGVPESIDISTGAVTFTQQDNFSGGYSPAIVANGDVVSTGTVSARQLVSLGSATINGSLIVNEPSPSVSNFAFQTRGTLFAHEPTQNAGVYVSPEVGPYGVVQGTNDTNTGTADLVLEPYGNAVRVGTATGTQLYRCSGGTDAGWILYGNSGAAQTLCTSGGGSLVALPIYAP